MEPTDELAEAGGSIQARRLSQTIQQLTRFNPCRKCRTIKCVTAAGLALVTTPHGVRRVYARLFSRQVAPPFGLANMLDSEAAHHPFISNASGHVEIATSGSRGFPQNRYLNPTNPIWAL